MYNLNKNNFLVAPVLKWVGGKRQLIEIFLDLIPENFSYYCEPFLGGGALFFYLQPKNAFINDINSDLILVYKIIRDDVENLISELENFKNNSDFFYYVRNLDRNKEIFNSLSDVQRAARIIFLNKTCYNGLYRVNNSGEFNSPFGNYKNPNIINAPVLRAVSKYFNSAHIHLTSVDYAEILAEIPKKTFVYLDPPYDPISTTSNFTGYSKGGFNRDEQIRLKESCDFLTANNIKFMLSNSKTDFILNLYSSYNITTVQAKRSINSVGSGRGNVDEIVVRNYG